MRDGTLQMPSEVLEYVSSVISLNAPPGLGVRHNHCDLWYVQGSTGRFVVKLIESEALFRVEDPDKLAGWLLSVGSGYEASLLNIGVPLPEHNELSVVSGAAQIFVVQIMSDCGSDYWTSLSYATWPLDTILHHLAPWIERWDWRLDVGIDPNPANFGGGVFFDLFPARYEAGGTVLVGFPQPDCQEDVEYVSRRYYTAQGILRLLRFCVGLIRDRDPTHAIVSAAHRVYDSEVAARIASFFAELPETRLHSLLEDGRLSDVEKEIARFGPYDVDALRGIAHFLLPHDELADALQLSTVDFRLPQEVREQRLDELKRRLILRVRE